MIITNSRKPVTFVTNFSIAHAVGALDPALNNKKIKEYHELSLNKCTNKNIFLVGSEFPFLSCL